MGEPKRVEGEPTNKFQLLYDRGANEYEVVEYPAEDISNPDSDYRAQRGYMTEVGLFDTREELDAEVARLKSESLEFAVYGDPLKGETFVREVEFGGGSYQRVGAGLDLIKVFKDKGEAEAYASGLKESYDRAFEQNKEKHQ